MFASFFVFDFLKLVSSSSMLPKHYCSFVLLGMFYISLNVPSVFFIPSSGFFLVSLDFCLPSGFSGCHLIFVSEGWFSAIGLMLKSAADML